ncbi:MAG: hypothetical protein M1812_005492 [Candelaria pacifica]|nr:MAG: hypothetical protein M1812_005492 [Candelaria pacifica]
MDSARNVASAAGRAIYGEGDGQSGREPVSGQTGRGTATEPYDAGNSEGDSRLSGLAGADARPNFSAGRDMEQRGNREGGAFGGDTYGSDNPYSSTTGTTGTTSTAPIDTSAMQPSTGPSPFQPFAEHNGPHQTSLANKLDPGVDTDGDAKPNSGAWDRETSGGSNVGKAGTQFQDVSSGGPLRSEGGYTSSTTGAGLGGNSTREPSTSAIGGAYGSSTTGGNYGSPTAGGNYSSSSTGGGLGSSSIGGNHGSSTTGGYTGSSTTGGEYGSSTIRGNYGSSTTGSTSGSSTIGGGNGSSVTERGSTSGGDYGSSTTGGNYDSSSTGGNRGAAAGDYSRDSSTIAGSGVTVAQGSNFTGGQTRPEHETDKTGVTGAHGNDPKFSDPSSTNANSSSVSARGQDRGPIGGVGAVEPSVGADPKSGQKPQYKQQGGDRPEEEPNKEQTEAVKSEKEKTEGKKSNDEGTANVKKDPNDHSGEPIHMHTGNERKGSTHPGQAGGEPHGEDKESKGTGEQWVKTSGLATDGGDFDAAKPGAGKEADRLLEKKGVHRDPGPGKAEPEGSKPSAAGEEAKPSMGDKIKAKLHMG